MLQPETFTLSAWFKIDDPLTEWGWIAGEGDNFGLALHRYTQEDLLFYYNNPLGGEPRWKGIAVDDLGYEDGQWHHVAGTYDNTSRAMVLYFDGVEIANDRGERPIGYTVGDGIHMGSMLGERYLKGSIDEVRLYDRVLLPADIQELGDL